MPEDSPEPSCSKEFAKKCAAIIKLAKEFSKNPTNEIDAICFYKFKKNNDELIPVCELTHDSDGERPVPIGFDLNDLRDYVRSYAKLKKGKDYSKLPSPGLDCDSDVYMAVKPVEGQSIDGGLMMLIAYVSYTPKGRETFEDHVENDHSILSKGFMSCWG